MKLLHTAGAACKHLHMSNTGGETGLASLHLDVKAVAQKDYS